MRYNLELPMHYEEIKSSVHCEPATITALATMGGSAIQGAGNYMAGNAQANASEDQLKQANRMFETEQNLRGDYATWLQNNFNNFGMAQLPDPNKYFDPANINKQYDIGKQNLNQTMGGMVNDASAQAGALGASRGYANNNAFVGNMANQVRQSFVPQFGQLEQNRAGALDANSAKLFASLFGNANMQNQFNQNRFNNANQVANFRLG